HQLLQRQLDLLNRLVTGRLLRDLLDHLLRRTVGRQLRVRSGSRAGRGQTAEQRQASDRHNRTILGVLPLLEKIAHNSHSHVPSTWRIRAARHAGGTAPIWLGFGKTSSWGVPAQIAHSTRTPKSLTFSCEPFTRRGVSPRSPDFCPPVRLSRPLSARRTLVQRPAPAGHSPYRLRPIGDRLPRWGPGTTARARRPFPSRGHEKSRHQNPTPHPSGHGPGHSFAPPTAREPVADVPAASARGGEMSSGTVAPHQTDSFRRRRATDLSI